MKISGSLKERFIDFYRYDINGFDDTGIYTQNFYLDYFGEVTPNPWFLDKYRILEIKQEKYLQMGITNINKLLKSFSMIDFKYDNLEISLFEAYNRLIKDISKTDRNMTFKIYELLYSKLKNAKNFVDLSNILHNFQYLLKTINQFDLVNQIDFEIILSLFEKNEIISKDSILSEKRSIFLIDIDELDEKNRTLLTFGEFIAPKRVASIAYTLQQNQEYSAYILPTFFIIKSEVDAKKWLELNKNSQIDTDIIKQNLKRMRIPSKLKIK